MSLIEMSHRSAEYDATHADALERLRATLEVPDDFEVLFVQGGALLQFAMVPMNLLPGGSTAGYVRSGAWGKAAHADAERAASAFVAWDGTHVGFTRMPEPDEITVEADARYVHVTSNETIEGIQLRTLPDLGVPLVVDISSDFLTQPVNWDLVDLV
jgi:phosphoserine aminotransferase